MELLSWRELPARYISTRDNIEALLGWYLYRLGVLVSPGALNVDRDVSCETCFYGLLDLLFNKEDLRREHFNITDAAGCFIIRYSRNCEYMDVGDLKLLRCKDRFFRVPLYFLIMAGGQAVAVQHTLQVVDKATVLMCCETGCVPEWLRILRKDVGMTCDFIADSLRETYPPEALEVINQWRGK